MELNKDQLRGFSAAVEAEAEPLCRRLYEQIADRVAAQVNMEGAGE